MYRKLSFMCSVLLTQYNLCLMNPLKTFLVGWKFVKNVENEEIAIDKQLFCTFFSNDKRESFKR